MKSNSEYLRAGIQHAMGGSNPNADSSQVADLAFGALSYLASMAASGDPYCTGEILRLIELGRQLDQAAA